MMFTVVDRNGETTLEDTVIYDRSDVDRVPGLAWTGDRLAVAFLRMAALGEAFGTKPSLMWVSGSDTEHGEPLVWGDSGGSITDWVDVAWSGSEYGVVWIDRWANRSLLFATIDEPMTHVGDQVILAEEAMESNITWTGSEWGIHWSQSARQWFGFTTVHVDGVQGAVAELPVWDDSPFTEVGPHVAWSGSEFGLAWSSSSDEDLAEQYFNRLGFCD